jgi:hypothetical protein
MTLQSPSSARYSVEPLSVEALYQLARDEDHTPAKAPCYDAQGFCDNKGFGHCNQQDREKNMKKSLMTLAGPVLFGIASLSLPALAQNPVLRTCRAEWRANQAGLRANGITQEVYVADCQTAATKGSAATVPAAADPAGKAASKAGKTVKTCQREWHLSKTAL